MKNKKIKMPAKLVSTRYEMVMTTFIDCEGSVTSVGDPTNYCTTILTTTHFV